VKVAAIYGPRVSTDNARPFQEMVSAKWTNEITDDLDAVVIFGGDGTVHRHLPRLSELKIPVLLVPYGSGNDFASGLGINTLEDAMHAWHKFADHEPNVHAIDIGCISHHRAQDSSDQPLTTSHLFCNVANLGLDADINRRANRLPGPIRANGGYILSLFPALIHYQAQAVTLRCLEANGNSRDIDEPAMLVAFANGTRYGRGLQIAPKADMDDGYLDLCFVRNMSKSKIAALFPIVYFGQHLRLPEIEYFKFRRIRVETPTPTEIYADGDFLCHTPAEISVVEAGLRVITPDVLGFHSRFL
jgi:diacylglycerol kinase (ATP)